MKMRVARSELGVLILATWQQGTAKFQCHATAASPEEIPLAIDHFEELTKSQLLPDRRAWLTKRLQDKFAEGNPR